MLDRLLRARALAPALFLLLPACGEPRAEARVAAAQMEADPPQLWLAQAMEGERVTGEVLVCADRVLRDGFARANAEVGGQPCLPFKDGVERPGLYAVRCQLGGRNFGLTVNRAGDPEADFTIRFAMKALDGTGAEARSVRRFRRLGACPAGWRIGDEARPGRPPHRSTVAGTWGA